VNSLELNLSPQTKNKERKPTKQKTKKTNIKEDMSYTSIRFSVEAVGRGEGEREGAGGGKSQSIECYSKTFPVSALLSTGKNHAPLFSPSQYNEWI
jgi:hypothetical protein